MSVDLKQALKSIQGFSALTDSDLEQLVPMASIRSLRAGETIFCQGEPSPYCFGILSGEVVIQHMSKDRRFPAKVLGMLCAGDLFGESSIFEESPRAAMASATKDGKLLTIRGRPLREWIQKNPAAGQPLLIVVLQAMIRRLRKTSLELSVVYGVGRLLGSADPFAEQLSAALEFLKGSLEGMTDGILYKRQASSDTLLPITSFPVLADLPAIAVTHDLIREVERARCVKVLKSPLNPSFVETFNLPWKAHAAMAIIPLFGGGKSKEALQGLMILSSQHQPQAFSGEKQILLDALALPFSESFSRH